MSLPQQRKEVLNAPSSDEGTEIHASIKPTFVSEEASALHTPAQQEMRTKGYFEADAPVEGKVPWYYSLKLKLFLLTNALIVLSIGFLSLQNTNSFRGVLNRQSEENLVNSSLLLNKSLEQNIQYWVNLGATTLQVSGINNQERLESALGGLVLSNPSIYRAAVFQVENKQVSELGKKDSASLAPDAKKYDLSQILRKVSSRTSPALIKNSQDKKSFYINSYLRDKDMPFVQIGTKLVQKSEGNTALTKDIWIVLSLAPDSISGVLTKNDTVAQYVIDFDGKQVFTAGNQQKHFNFQNASIKRMEPIKSGASKFVLWSQNSADGTPITSMATPIKSFDLLLINQRKSTFDQIQIDEQIRNILLLSWIVFLLSIALNYVVANGITKKLSIAVESTAQIARGNFNARISNFGRDEVGSLSRAINRMAIDIGVLIGVRENAIRQESELRMAEGVQKTMIPGPSVARNGVHTYAIFRAASECAGDWWGRFSLSEEEELVVLADVTGHGAHSALVGALAYGYFSTLESSHVLKESKLGPEKVLSDLNRILFKAGQGSLTLTAIAVLINRRTKEVRVASAAHCQAELIRNSSSTVVKAKGDLIGLAPTFSAEEQSFFIEPSDLIFLYTDGLLECKGVDGKNLSKKGLRKILTEGEDLSSKPQVSHSETRVDSSETTLLGLQIQADLSTPAHQTHNASDLAHSTYKRFESFVKEHFEEIQTSDDISALLISFDHKEVKK